ncbi:lipopolysaccharide assembly protein LapA domain-containing protein [Tepidicella baoligensis]|uniref:lipopolysaccharide assembly protein LapA domain-containing protein n=1 Tax=Tepidicella baoligensis TaxID=2707016 RepID=UPI0015DAE0D1
MKYLSWLLKAAIFLTVFAFALNNQGDVRLHLFFGAYWDAPLVLVVLVALAIGVFLGIAVMVPPWLRARKAARLPRTETPATSAQATSPGEPPPHGI